MSELRLSEMQARLKDEFVRIHGCWHSMWDEVLQSAPEHFEAYLRFSGLPHRSGPLSPKVKELICIAVSASVTHLYAPSLRVHIKNALTHGATKAEILEVFELVSILGIHAMSFSVPILLKELERLGKPVDLVNLSPRAKEVQAEWVRTRGYWPDDFTAMLALDPDFVESFVDFATVMRTIGPLDRKTIELIYIAVDGSTNHLFPEGVRNHTRAALENGATVEEIMETLELVSNIGMHSMSFSVPILIEEIEQSLKTDKE